MNKTVPIAGPAGAVPVLGFCRRPCFCGDRALAQTPSPSGEKVIPVTGTAAASADPDLPAVTFGVQTQEKTAGEAPAANSESMDAAVSAVRQLGIPGDVPSRHLSRLRGPPGRQRHMPAGAGRVRGNRHAGCGDRPDSAAGITDGAAGAGAGGADGVCFALAPETTIQTGGELLELDVVDARIEAENAPSPHDRRILGVKPARCPNPACLPRCMLIPRWPDPQTPGLQNQPRSSRRGRMPERPQASYS